LIFKNNLWFQVFEKNNSVEGHTFSVFEKSETKTRRQDVNGNYSLGCTLHQCGGGSLIFLIVSGFGYLKQHQIRTAFFGVFEKSDKKNCRIRVFENSPFSWPLHFRF